MKIILIELSKKFELLKSKSSNLIDNIKEKTTSTISAKLGLTDEVNWKPHWTIYKYHGDPKQENLFAIEEIPGNLLLNEGITELLKLLIGTTATAFNNTNTYIGVGDSTTAASAAQTGLQASTNKAYKPMDSTYPQVSNQQVIFRATFGPTDANYDWQEFTVANGNSDSAKNLNRKVEDHGRKASGDSWVIQLTITIS